MDPQVIIFSLAIIYFFINNSYGFSEVEISQSYVASSEARDHAHHVVTNIGGGNKFTGTNDGNNEVIK